MSRGFFGIGIYHPKIEANEGILMRSAFLHGASFVFTIGRRYQRTAADTPNTQLHVPMFHYENVNDFLNFLPKKTALVGVELDPRSHNLHTFRHPERAVYVLGAEDAGLNDILMDHCDSLVQIPTEEDFSLNVSAAGSILMYDRGLKGKI